MHTTTKYMSTLISTGTFILLTACGGGGGGGDNNSVPPTDNGGNGTTSFTVTAIAGSGGTITPTSTNISQNETVSLTIVVDSGFNIESVVGCGGTLSGNSYTTSTITADCTVNAQFSENNANADDVVLNLRPVSSEIDFDNNGVMDAMELFTYDTDGRQTSYEYNYTGDGIDDLYRTNIAHYQNSVQYTETYSYDTQGQLITLEINDQLQDTTFGSSRRVLLSYEYDNNNVASRGTQESFDSANALTSRVFFDYSYDSEGRLDSIAITNDDTVINLPSSPSIVVRTDVSYNAQSQPIELRGVNNTDSVLIVQNLTYSASGQLIRDSRSSDGSTINSAFRDFIHNNSSCNTQELEGNTNSDGIVSEANRRTNQYEGAGDTISGSQWDQGDDGSIEVVLTLQTERETYIPFTIAGTLPDTRLLVQALLCTP